MKVTTNIDLKEFWDDIDHCHNWIVEEISKVMRKEILAEIKKSDKWKEFIKDQAIKSLDKAIRLALAEEIEIKK